MKSRLFVLICNILCVVMFINAQTPTVQLKIKEKSGFLGMGGPRIVQIELSNQNRQRPLTCDNVNKGAYYYFLFTPVGDWQLDADFVTNDLAAVTVYQNEKKNPIAWKSDIIEGGNTSILLGFPKTIKLNQLFLFQCPIDEAMSQTEFKVPQELWPGYSLITDLAKRADAATTAKQYKQSIVLYEQILGNDSLQIFPQHSESKNKRTKCFDQYYNEIWTSFQAAATNAQMELKARISMIDDFRPAIKFIIDSLPRPAWSIGSLDPTVAPILDRCRNAVAQILNIHDSLQHVLDDQTVRWIMEGSVTSKTGYLYGYMIKTLAWAFSSLNFNDTALTELKVKIPDDYQALLTKYNIAESYVTFLRICNERYQTHLPIFPIDFLQNLRKDTISFELPYYSMLKAVNDYYYNNLPSTKDEIFHIFRTCYDWEFNYRFDMLRVAIFVREQQISPDILKMFDEAKQFEAKKDLQNAEDKYRQITIIAPTFADGFYELGKFYAHKGDLIRAIYNHQRAYQIDTLFISAYHECYSLYMKQSNFKPMIEVLTSALSKGNDYWEVNYTLGTAYLGDADPSRAIKSFERALGLNPKSYNTNIQLGLAYQNVKDYQKAREYFNNAIGLDPTKQQAVDFLTKLNELQRTGK